MRKFQRLIDIPRWIGSQRRIGITGGIASGKSSIGRYLREKKELPILDADIFSKEALEPETMSSKAVIARYGNVVLNPNLKEKNTINRKALANIIFNDEKERYWIEKIIHPIVEQKIYNCLELYKNHPIIVLIIPLLFEANLTHLCNEIWVIYCSKDEQYARLRKRDGLTHKEAELRINSQFSLKEKLRLADVVLDNSGELKVWKRQINQLI